MRLPIVFAMAVVLLAAFPRASSATGRVTTIDARVLADRLRHGDVALRAGSVVRGVLDLGRRTTHSLTCRRCRFDGGIVASQGAAHGTLELAGSEVTGAVVLSRATFRGRVDLHNALVEGLIDAHAAKFRGGFTASFASFSELTSFSSATFKGRVDFSFATFGGPALFADATVFRSCRKPKKPHRRWRCAGGSSFTSASFANVADFSSAELHSSAIFKGTRFGGEARFGGAQFFRTTSFEQARFDEGASFVAAQFSAGSAYEQSDSFLGVDSGGALSFVFAVFDRTTDFEDSNVRGALSFSGATGSGRDLNFSNVEASDLVMDVPFALRAVAPEQRRAILGQIEASAKRRDDLATANDADYASRVLASRRHGRFVRTLDCVFFRGIAGYFVRPLHPLLALLALMLLMAVSRAVGRAAAVKTTVVLRVWTVFRSVPAEFRKTVFLVLPERWARGVREPQPPSGSQRLWLARLAVPPPPTLGDRAWSCVRWVGAPVCSAIGAGEVLFYRLLVACVLIGLANANPTLRDMVNAIH
jgi:hypothetical protein